MLCYFYVYEYYFQSAVVILILLISIIINIAKVEVLFDPSMIEPGNLPENTNILGKYLDRWRSEYSHPLYVKRMAAFTEEFDDEARNREAEKMEIKVDNPNANEPQGNKENLLNEQPKNN